MKQYGKVLQIFVERKYKLLVGKIVTKIVSDCNGVFFFKSCLIAFVRTDTSLKIKTVGLAKTCDFCLKHSSVGLVCVGKLNRSISKLSLRL
jgi:hypothetical protein